MVKFLLVILFSIKVFSLQAQGDPLRIMTFNIRLPVESDGINYWDKRRPLVVSTIRFHDADIIGVQEAFRRQLDEMVSDMPQYEWFGVCRTDGTVHPNPDSEFSAILYRKDRFEFLEGNTFWLSATPEMPGSVGWDAALPRVVTWAKFRDRLSDKVFFHFNTHFDHIGEQARHESAKLLLTKAQRIAGDLPVVITGDFNSEVNSSAYRMMTDVSLPYFFFDALPISITPHHGPLGTFSGSFQLPGVGSNRIDFIFVRPEIVVLRHAILSDSWDGRLPSDHLPVLAEIEIKN